MKPLKLCKDCRHFYSEKEACNHPSNIAPISDYVHGRLPLHVTKFEFAQSCRISTFKDCCGPDAQYWEPKL